MISCPPPQRNQDHHNLMFCVWIISYLWGISLVSCSMRNTLSRDPVTQSCKYACSKTRSLKKEMNLKWIRVSVEQCKHYTALEISSSAMFCFLHRCIFFFFEMRPLWLRVQYLCWCLSYTYFGVTVSNSLLSVCWICLFRFLMCPWLLWVHPAV